MKKIMMTLAVVAVATLAQASTYNWKSAKGGLYKAGTATLLTTGTAYLFDANKFDQEAFVKALFIDKTYTDAAAAFAAKGIADSANSNIQSTGKINASSDFTYNGEVAGSNWNAYFVIVDGDNVYVSASQATSALSIDTAQPIAFNSPATASKAAAMDGTAGWTSAGWYTAAPEPTSGLLLLLGVAGLALRRRRA